MGYIFLIKTNRISQVQVMPIESRVLEKPWEIQISKNEVSLLNVLFHCKIELYKHCFNPENLTILSCNKFKRKRWDILKEENIRLDMYLEDIFIFI